MDENVYLKRTIVKEQVPSNHLDAPRPLRIYLPPGYNELISYPVIYCQDGEDFFNFGRIATTMNRLIYDENIEPAIIVGVDVDKSVRTAEYAPEGDRFAAYCRFFAEELLPFVESRYPVRGSAEDRILAGDSLGGTVSLHLALDYRSLFYRVLSLSGAFLEGTRSRIAQETDLSWLELHMVIGTEENEVATERGTYDFLEANRQAKAMLEDRNCRLSYEEKPGRHVWGLWQQELPGMLKRMME
ncbi:putative esterase [Paenibacillus mucilaginosus 3016]|uniref:Putative esterase n=1 Tax=Paenibacillus mucilaginosus 3016 TaxID=1116391 RepID=H6NPK8_9BACL|nr:alpha/beta hydrolase-fold protein [Paenibacillus mucilaginosus]AFC32620.1 putative esterase [Paenibacillus mucilaginosus 3016]WFA21093.1 esterase family protein [Paenibacillus mucilaginosus]